MDYYEILGISRNATQEEIRKAYRTLAQKYHPDRNPGDSEAEAKFKIALEAYQTLSDHGKRARYNGSTTRPSSAPKKTPSGFQSIFEEFFGGGASRGRNIQIHTEVTLQEIFKGCRKKVDYKKRARCHDCEGRGYTSYTPCNVCGGTGFGKMTSSPFQFTTHCSKCQGTGRMTDVKCSGCVGTGFSHTIECSLDVDIPAGMENGMQVRIPEEGEDGMFGARKGDLFVVVLIAEHNLFKIDGHDLTCDIPVSYTQLIFGDEIEIPTLEEGVVKVKIPEGTQSHTRFRMKGRGLPDLRGNWHGDIVATVKIEVPKDLNEEYKSLLEKLAEFEQENISCRRQEWAKKMAS